MPKPTTIWEVEYEERAKGSKEWAGGDSGAVWILANSSEEASRAISKRRVGQTYDWEDDDEKTRTETIAEVRLTKVERIGEIDLFA